MNENGDVSRMQDEINLSRATVTVSIDVGKTALNICVLPSADAFQVKNNVRGIRRLIRRCQRLGV
ncbi:MAG: hypothetical protein AAGF33_05410 [Pseudomonadota bacterium]